VPTRPIARPQTQPVIVFCADGLGDHIMSIPTIVALSRAVGAQMTLVTRSGMQQLFYQGCEFAACVEVPMAATERGWEFDPHQAARACPPGSTVFVLAPYRTPSLDEWIRLIAPQFVAWATAEGSDVDDCGKRLAHEVDRMFAVVMQCDFAWSPEQCRRWTLPYKAWLWADAVRAQVVCDSCVGMLVMHFETGYRKCLSEREVIGLVRRLRAYLDRWGLVIVAENRPFYANTVEGLGTRIVSGVAIESIFALVRTADAFLGCDSCMLHAADIQGVPCVGIFRSTNPSQWGCRFAPCARIQWPLADAHRECQQRLPYERDVSRLAATFIRAASSCHSRKNAQAGGHTVEERLADVTGDSRHTVQGLLSIGATSIPQQSQLRLSYSDGRPPERGNPAGGKCDNVMLTT